MYISSVSVCDTMKVFMSFLVVAVVLSSAHGCLLKKKCLMKQCESALSPLLAGLAPPAYGAPLAAAYPYNPYNPYAAAAPVNPLAAFNPYAQAGLGCGCGCGGNPLAQCLCKVLKPCLWKKSLLSGCC